MWRLLSPVVSQGLQERLVPFRKETREFPCLTEQYETFRSAHLMRPDEGLQALVIRYSAFSYLAVLAWIVKLKRSFCNGCHLSPIPYLYGSSNTNGIS